MRSIIIDDELQSRNALREEIDIHCPDVRIIAEADSVKTAVEAIDDFHPDLVFLDVQLGDGNGFDVIEKTTFKDYKIIFITAFSDYAIRAFRVSAIDYLLKPLNGAELRMAVDRIANSKDAKPNSETVKNLLHNLKEEPNKRIAFPTSEGISLHYVNDIIRCESDNNYCQIFFKGNEKLFIAKTLKDLEVILIDFGFERVHQSHLVNVLHVKKYINRDGGTLLLTDGSQVPVSQRKKSMILDRLMNE